MKKHQKIWYICIIALVALAVFTTLFFSYRCISQYGQQTSISSDPKEDVSDQQISEPSYEEQIPSNAYRLDKFFEIDGIRYYEDMKFSGVPGIDVSSYQQQIDWQQVKEAGIEFAIIRAGYRGWSSGKLDQDDCFTRHVEGALDAGIDVGVYFFSQALTPEEAAEEAQYTLAMIEQYDISGPIVFDWEEVDAADARTNEMNMLMLTSCADAFCRVVSDAGYQACVYFNQAYGYEQFNLVSLEEYDFWLAEYNEIPSFVYDFQIWQYSNEGQVPGIEGNVDLNIMFKQK